MYVLCIMLLLCNIETKITFKFIATINKNCGLKFLFFYILFSKPKKHATDVNGNNGKYKNHGCLLFVILLLYVFVVFFMFKFCV